MVVGGGQGTPIGQIQCPSCRATLPAGTAVCPICSTNLKTAASLAATHTQVAAVASSPEPGSAVGPAPAGGFQPEETWAEGAAAGPAPAIAPPPQPTAPPGAPAPAESVESLLGEARVVRDEERPSREARGRPSRGARERRKRAEGKELSPEEMREGAMRLSLLILLLIVVVGTASAFIRRGMEEGFIRDVIDIGGIIALALSLYLLAKAGSVNSKTRERLAASESSRLSYIRLGGVLLWLVPIAGSFLGTYLGVVYQAAAMHPAYYIIVAAGVLLILVGLSGLKERGTYYQVFMFGVYGIVLSTIPMALRVMAEAMASAFWWTSTFLMISIGYIFMAFVLRQMRAGQYAQLDEVLAKAERAFLARRLDQAMKYYSEAITLTHTLYSDAVFSARNPRVRGKTSVPDEYFRPWIGKAKCLALTGKLRKALAIYDLMLEVDPDNAPIWFDRGRILKAEKRFAEAYISFDKAVKIDPGLEDAQRSRQEVLDIIREMHA